jgi:FKBP-type peptidyl-prolyl cis-trans isomerase SlyD
MKIGENKVVSIDYKLTDENGTVLDSSEGNGALSYIHGIGQLIPGLEEALEGKEEGEQVQAEVTPDQAYGDYDDSLLFAVPKERMPQDTNLEVGMQFEAQTQQGDKRIVTLSEVGDEEVKLDANHPLAGRTLTFDVTVEGVRDATSEELSHGHVHEDDESTDE